MEAQETITAQSAALMWGVSLSELVYLTLKHSLTVLDPKISPPGSQDPSHQVSTKKLIRLLQSEHHFLAGFIIPLPHEVEVGTRNT